MKRICFFLFLASGLTAYAGTYLLECETFPLQERWTAENAAAASGKKFLRSVEKEAPAEGKYVFPETGIYYVWVRNLSFSQNWRKAVVSVDGKCTSAVGDEKTTLDTPAWIWSRSRKPLYIEAGEHKISLAGVSASVRADCVLFTTDKNVTPRDGELPEKDTFAVLLPSDAGSLRGELTLEVSTGKDALSYRCREKIVFRVTAKCDGEKVARGGIVYRLRSDDGADEKGIFPLGEGKETLVLETELERPGFVRLTADLVDEKGDPMRGVSGDGKVSFAHFDGGAGAEIDRIGSLPEPEDFDDFWKAQKARLGAVPLRAEAKRLPKYSDGEFETCAVTIDCAGGRPATGFLVLPVGAAKGSLAAEIHFEGYGTGIPAVPGSSRRRSDAMVFFLNAHGSPLEATPEEYASFFAARKDYALSGNADAEKCYFNGMVLRVLRGCEYLENRPEWNGCDLVAVGGSQGGLQALWAAALDGCVSRCAVEVPWNCNMGGRTLGLMAPEWGIAEYEKGLAYYDPVYFAGRIACPVEIGRAGLGDYICPPSGVARMYYNLRCAKKITWFQNSDHGFASANAMRWTFEEKQRYKEDTK